MSDRFTTEEIELLSGMPVVTAQMVVAVDTNGIMAAVRELAGMARCIERGVADYPTNALIRLVHAELHNVDLDAVAARKKASSSAEKAESFDQVLAAFFAEIDKVVQLVAERAPGSEGRDYCQWLNSIAKGTAEASKESGFLGIGGKKISESESSFLSDLETHLAI